MAKKILFGFWALFPMVIVAAGVVTLAGLVELFPRDGPDLPAWLEYALTGVLLSGWVAFIIDVWAGGKVPVPKRKLWAVVLVLGNVYAMPFYYWWYVLPAERSDREEAASSHA